MLNNLTFEFIHVSLAVVCDLLSGWLSKLQDFPEQDIRPDALLFFLGCKL